MRRVSLSLVCLLLGLAGLSESAAAAPEILTTADNAVPACATPDRLMSFLKARNKKLDPRYAEIADAYARHGNELQLRWDYAFYQMILETNALSYRTARGRWGDVKPLQNNFAGIGASGRRNPGESFKDIETGVLGHLHHIRLYAGEPVETPAAKRTELVRGIILPWAQAFGRPLTFADLAARWAPPNKHYVRDLQSIEKAFVDTHCTGATEVAGARPRSGTKGTVAANTHKSDRSGAVSEKDLSSSAMSLGVGSDLDDGANRLGQTPSAKTKVAALQTLPIRKPKSDCKVYTASYGGAKTLLIAATDGRSTLYTALGVHDEKADAQAAAYIDTYAKGGETIATFDSQTAALAKAFELCPDE